MLNKLRVRAQGESGFTLVELLVVMLILGLLAAIAIPSFFNQRDKARDADAKSAVRTAQTAMETYHQGTYAGAAPADLVTIENTLSDVGARLTVPATTAESYTVQVASSNTPNVFRITRNANGTTVLQCDNDGNDGCPANGIWG
jgi:type IV pilus assembly protein PilA